MHQKPAADAWLFVTKRGRARSKAMPSFGWTGELRPDRVSPRSEASHVMFVMRCPSTQNVEPQDVLQVS